MGNLTRYTAADLPVLLDKISKNSIGMHDYLNRVFDLHETTTNYPPYNLIEVSSVESLLEIALAGFKKKEVNVYTQDRKNICPQRNGSTIIHQNLDIGRGDGS